MRVLLSFAAALPSAAVSRRFSTALTRHTPTRGAALFAVGLMVTASITGGCQQGSSGPAGLAVSVNTNAASLGAVGGGTPGETKAAVPNAERLQKTNPLSNVEPARIGKPAPAFSLPTLDGKTVNLADHAGKVVVLEWFNPECPFVRAAHTKGSLVDTAERLQKQGVVYLAINSAASGKQGHGVESNRAGVEKFKLSHPVLLDETGSVGKAYGATNTPHIFVIDAKGLLAYRGAVDNSPDGEGESPEGGKLVSFLEEAVSAVLAGQPVKASETKAYGCSVKYGT